MKTIFEIERMTRDELAAEIERVTDKLDEKPYLIDLIVASAVKLHPDVETDHATATLPDFIKKCAGFDGDVTYDKLVAEIERITDALPEDEKPYVIDLIEAYYKAYAVA